MKTTKKTLVATHVQNILFLEGFHITSWRWERERERDGPRRGTEITKGKYVNIEQCASIHKWQTKRVSRATQQQQQHMEIQQVGDDRWCMRFTCLWDFSSSKFPYAYNRMGVFNGYRSYIQHRYGQFQWVSSEVTWAPFLLGFIFWNDLL